MPLHPQRQIGEIAAVQLAKYLSEPAARLRATSVIDCPPEATAIAEAVQRAFALDCTGVVNPYGDGHAAPRIVAAIKAVSEPATLIKKRFFDLERRA